MDAVASRYALGEARSDRRRPEPPSQGAIGEPTAACAAQGDIYAHSLSHAPLSRREGDTLPLIVLGIFTATCRCSVALGPVDPCSSRRRGAGPPTDESRRIADDPPAAGATSPRSSRPSSGSVVLRHLDRQGAPALLNALTRLAGGDGRQLYVRSDTSAFRDGNASCRRNGPRRQSASTSPLAAEHRDEGGPEATDPRFRPLAERIRVVARSFAPTAGLHLLRRPALRAFTSPARGRAAVAVSARGIGDISSRSP